ncbi:MAG: hypothetical protein ACYC7F_02350 [Gemmatimonadaceae bacterium]
MRCVEAEPGSPDLLKTLRDSITEYLGATLTPRAKGRGVSLRRRVAGIVRTHASTLPKEMQAQVREMCSEHLPAYQDRLSEASQSERIDECEAALRLGISVAQLLLVCRDPDVRRQLGWPRPLANRLYFLRRIFDVRHYADVIAQLPDVEPWPRAMWPEGWRG